MRLRLRNNDKCFRLQLDMVGRTTLHLLLRPTYASLWLVDIRISTKSLLNFKVVKE